MKQKRTPLNQLVGPTAAATVQASSISAPVNVTPAPARVNTRKARARTATPTREVYKPMPDSVKQLNVEIPLELHRRVKVKAMLEGKSLVALVEELLEEWANQ